MNRDSNQPALPTAMPSRETAKRPYSRPMLVAYGRVEDMTRGGSNTKKVDPGSKPGKP